jgi:hypothetical protein
MQQFDGGFDLAIAILLLEHENWRASIWESRLAKGWTNRT